MPTIVSDVYKFDLRAGDAAKEVLALVDAFEKQEKAARDAAGAAGDVGAENKKLADIEKQLAAVLEQEARTVDGLTSKKDALLKISKRLSAEQKQQFDITGKLVTIEKELADAAEKAMKAQGGLNDSLKKGSLQISAFIKAGAGIGAFAVGIDAAARQVQQLDAFIQSTQSSIQGLSREGATVLAGDIIGTATTFTGVEQDELLDAIKSASNEFQEDAFVVLEEINVGLIKSTTERARGEIVEQLKEYSTQLAGAGLTLQESIGVINLGDSLGIFSDKAADAVKEVGLRLGEQTKPTVDAVTNAFGEQFSKKLFSDLDEGLSTFDAFKRISEEIGNVDLNQQQYAQLVADVGGGALEDAGRRFFEAVKDVGEGTAGINEGLTEFQAAQAKLLDTNREIGRTQTQVADTLSDLSREYADATAGARLFVTRGVLRLAEVLRELPGFIRDNKVEIGALIASFSITRVGAFVTAVGGITTAFKAQIVQARLLALANPYTAAIAGATALIATISILTKEQSNAAKTAKQVEESTKRVAAEYREEKTAVDALFKPLSDRNITDKERSRLIDEIQNKYGDYLGNIDLERTGAEGLAKAYDLVTSGILRSILAREKSRLQEEIITQITNKTIELNNATNENASLLDKATAAGFRLAGFGGIVQDAAAVTRNTLNKEIRELQEEFNNIPGVLGEVEKQLKGLEFGADVENALNKTTGATKRTQASTKDLENQVDKVKEVSETLEQRLQKLGLTIDASFAESVKNAGSQSEALGAVLDQLEAKLTTLEGEARKSATLETLPLLESLLESIRQEQVIIDDARGVLAREGLQIEPIETIDPSEITSTANVPELPVEIKLIEPEQRNIQAIFEKVISGFETASAAGFDLLSAVTDSQTANLDRLVSKQEETIADIEANSEDFNAQQVARELERLDTLEREQREAAERARDIAQVEVAANAALAIAKAATQPFPLNLVAIGATITGLIAGFTRANAAVAGAFYDGVDSLQRPVGVPRGRDTILIRANEGEQIISTDETEKMQRAGIKSRHDTVKYAIAGKRAHDERLKRAQQSVRVHANTDMAARMKVAGIPINNYIDTKEQREGNMLLREMLKVMRKEEKQPYQAPKKHKKNE